MARETWTDERLDDFGKHVDQRFDNFERTGDRRFGEVNQRLDKVDDRCRNLRRARRGRLVRASPSV